jgi:transcriptional regulator with XRE-family HTH domain
MADYARGDRLLELRAERRISRERLAGELGVTTKSVYAWEKRNGAIKWENALKVADFYGVDPGEVATREPEDLTPAYANLRRLEAKVDLLLAHFGLDVETVSDAVEAFDAETARAAGQQAAPVRQRRGHRAA